MSTVSGCHLNSENRLVLLGKVDGHVAIVEQEVLAGAVVKSLYLDNNKNLPRRNWPTIYTYGAIYHQIKSSSERYYYVSFIAND